MSRKHFQAFADAIKMIQDYPERCRTARLTADVCHGFNGMFDRGRFYTACDVKYEDC
jgi:hypothetical protein